MLKLLLKNNLTGIFIRFMGGKKGRGGIKAVLFLLLMAYVVGVFGWMFYQMFNMLSVPFNNRGLSWLYFSLAFIIAFAVTFILSVFATKNQLYEAKDNDLLLCLPINPSTILSARLISLWVQNFALGLIVMVPAAMVWIENIELNLKAMLFMLLLYVGLTFFGIAVSAFFGWILSAITSRMRKKNLFEVLFSLAIFVGYFYLYSQATAIIKSVIQNGQNVAESLGAVAPVYWVGAASANADLSSLVSAIIIFIVPYLIVHKILSSTFIKTATTKRGVAKVKYKGGPQKVSSLTSALLKRESKRFFSSSIYTMNAGLGAIFIYAAAVALLVFRSRMTGVISSLSGIAEYVVPICALAVGLMAGVSMPTSAAVSMEGKSLWICQSLPISPAKLIMAKLKFSLLVYLPAVIVNTSVLCFILEPDFTTAILTFILSIAMTVTMAEVGLAANLKLPKLDWQTEAQAVKQSSSVLVSMLINFGLVILIGYIAYQMYKNNAELKTIIMSADAIFAILSVALYAWLSNKGAKIYSSL